MAQVGNRLEQRRDDQVGDGAVVQSAAHQADFLQQQQHLQQVADILGVRDDVVAQRFPAVALQHVQRGLEDRQFALRQLAVDGGPHAQRPRVVEQPEQQRAPADFVERAVVGLDARHLEQFGQHGLVLVRTLPQVDGREMEAEHLHRAHQRVQARSGQRLRMVRQQRRLDDAQVRMEFAGVQVRVLRSHGMAQCFCASQFVQRGRQPRIQADQGAPVGLVLAVHVVIGRAVGQRLQRRRHRAQQARQRQLGAQLVHLRQVKAQHGLALAPQCHLQRGGRHVGVAVAVAADPVAHAEEVRDRVAGQGLFDLAIHARDLAQEGRVVVGQRVLDLVGHRQLGGAQHARLPQLCDARAHHRFALGALALGVQAVALFHQFGDGAFGVEDALALHLGRVGGQHGRDAGLAEHGGDVGGAHVGRAEPLERHRQRALVHVALLLVVFAPAHMVAVFGNIGQVREIAECADHADGLVAAQVLQQPVQRAAGLCVLLQAKRHRQLAHALDQLERGLALLFADHVAQDATEQTDVVDQRAVLFGGVSGRAAAGNGSDARHGHLDGWGRSDFAEMYQRPTRARGAARQRASCKRRAC